MQALRPGGLRITFLGVSSLLFDDGSDAVLIDGYFSRPGLLGMLRLSPDPAAIQAVMQRADLAPAFARLRAIAVTHAHFDHALDAAFIAARTGASLAGSASTANLGIGQGLPARQIRQMAPGGILEAGAFRLLFVRSIHSPGQFAVGEIEAPVHFPVVASALKMGECFAMLIEHRGRRVLVHASAGHLEGMYAKMPADTVFLGVGGLGKRDKADRQAYWSQVVGATGARQVYLVHWDNFFRPLSEPLEALPYLADRLDTTIASLERLAQRDGVQMRLPVAGQAIDLD